MPFTISWKSSSLVGSLNPHTGFRYIDLNTKNNNDTINKSNNNSNLPPNIICQFTSASGTQIGQTYDLPLYTSTSQLSTLIHTLLSEQDPNQERHQYSFYAQITRDNQDVELEVEEKIEDFLKKYEIGCEDVLRLVYKKVGIWRVRRVERCVGVMQGHEEAILYVEYSPCGRHLASGGGDTHVRFWDTHTHLPLFTCKSHRNHVLHVSWSSNSQFFASCDLSGKLITWDPHTGNPKKIIQAHAKHVSCISWEPCHLNEGRCQRLVTGSKDGFGKVWNVSLGKREATLCGSAAGLECIKWSGLGYIYTASRDTFIRVYATDNSLQSPLGTLIKVLSGHSHRVNTLALNCDTICRTGPFDFEMSHRNVVHKLKLSQRDAYEMAVKRYQTFQQNNSFTEILASGSDDHHIFLWHPQISKHPVSRLTGHQQLINHLCFSPNGHYFVSASFDKKIKLWSSRGVFLTTYHGHVGSVYRVSWSLDSRFFVSASKDSTAKVWSVNGKKCDRTLSGHEDEVYALDWSPDGVSVATGSKDRTIKIWKA